MYTVFWLAVLIVRYENSTVMLMRWHTPLSSSSFSPALWEFYVYLEVCFLFIHSAQCACSRCVHMHVCLCNNVSLHDVCAWKLQTVHRHGDVQRQYNTRSAAHTFVHVLNWAHLHC
jgi:hypothetical protein